MWLYCIIHYKPVLLYSAHKFDISARLTIQISSRFAYCVDDFHNCAVPKNPAKYSKEQFTYTRDTSVLQSQLCIHSIMPEIYLPGPNLVTQYLYTMSIMSCYTPTAVQIN